ncbi:ATP-binding protein [Methanobrevibacter curvatus]|uniref:Putative AAA-ATPase n=1 Tax=Methanobrevibacter curvatus TaxID=49547 RepID=A0A165ZKA3_9EURY|nr:ATP-binding protein [Methanobrevibacter curvatus]KZX10828.1 putative AAA-ATPase [Methanobrevibacter curvatus]
MKKLPVGIQTFSEIRENNYIYVDKTDYIFKMVDLGKNYFLSRPRRFGKSLIVSTLKELFEGNKNLFEGLYAYDKWNWDEQYPVIVFDLAKMSYESPDDLRFSLMQFIDNTAQKFSIILNNRDLSGKFSELLEKINEFFNKKVVVLVDEYDKPIIDYIDDLKVAKANRKVLHSFYQVIKSNDEYLKFVFLTGVSKFTNTSIFFGLNNPDDITLDKKYGAICGYTHTELEEYFKDYILELGENESLNMAEVLNEINYWYDGYSWDGKTNVYNPFFTLLLFNKMKFSNYWFKTGTPSFLINILKKNNDLKPILESITVSENSFNTFDIDNIGIISLLFQTGYLTIKEEKKVNRNIKYVLDIPNFEVKDSLINNLVEEYTNLSNEHLDQLKENIYDYILNNESNGLKNVLEEIYNQIPYLIKGTNEGFYHSIFLIILYLFGIEIQGEVLTYAGRIDAVFKIDDQIVITEIKYSSEKSIDKMINEAFNQIEDRKYYNKYKSKNHIYLALAFTKDDIACEFKNF